MIYQFDCFGHIVATHTSYIDAARWLRKHTAYVGSLTTGGIAAAIEKIAECCRLNDDLQCLRYPCFGFWFSEYSFLGDL